METNQKPKTITHSKSGQLQAILYLLQTNLEEFKDEVDRSYELLKIGEKTNLSEKIEATIDDPISSIFKLSLDIDNQLKSIVDRIVKSFLKHNSSILQSAYQLNTTNLQYAIVLKNDNIDNRNKIFDFFDKFDLLDIADKVTVNFQFVPAQLIEKMFVQKSIPLENQ